MPALTLPNRIGTPPTENAVIFIHGLNGTDKTWKHFAHFLFDSWKEEDCYDLEYDCYTAELGWVGKIPFLGSSIRAIKGGPKVLELSSHLKNTVDEVCKAHKRVILVAHSMGGLIARQYILDTLKDTKNTGKIKCLFTYATPHYGSKLASIYKFFINPILVPFRVFRGKSNAQQITDMARKNSEFLSDLNDEWTKLGVNDKIDFYRIIGGYDNVVDRESAAMKDKDNKNVKLVSGKNHFNIIKPTDVKDRAFLPLYNYLMSFKDKCELEDLEEEDEIFEEEY